MNLKHKALIEHIVEKFSAQEPQFCQYHFLSLWPFLISTVNFCMGSSLQTMNAINTKLLTLTELIIEKCSVYEP